MFGFGFKARKFWVLAVNSGFGAGKSQARPKANPGHYFGLALALVTQPKKPVQEGEDGAAHHMGRKHTKRKCMQRRQASVMHRVRAEGTQTPHACKKDAAAARRIDEAAASQADRVRVTKENGPHGQECSGGSFP
ncbi:hypothetical protein B0H14DRAFT_2576514 [Mycena olivaceomarginata]|nr:hypothetical protein B0H14DRAFT_2576514 [Mycena olivaceomarginata]